MKNSDGGELEVPLVEGDEGGVLVEEVGGEGDEGTGIGEVV